MKSTWIRFPLRVTNMVKDLSVPDIVTSSVPITKQEILNFGNEGFLLHNVLSPEECQHLISEAEKVGFEKLLRTREDYRKTDRIIFESRKLSELLWARVKPWLSEIIINGDPSVKHIHGVKFLLQGMWQPQSINRVFRLCRYFPGGHFAPHVDGYFVQSCEERSLQTLMLYLNGGFLGGGTNFIDEQQSLHRDRSGKFCVEDKNIQCRIQPEPGLALIFNHHRLHEGETLKTGVKYILRTDIMFHIVSYPERSPEENAVLELLQEAEKKEAAGEHSEAMAIYRKAIQLFPELAVTR